MRAFKKISISVIILFCVGILLASIPNIAPQSSQKMLKHQILFNQQLENISKVTNQRQILIYGSSGMLFGVSGEILERNINNVKVTNLSTGGFGGAIESAIELILPKIQQGDVLIIGDRRYRDSSANFLKKLPRINFLPQLRLYLNNAILDSQPTNNRGTNGDLLQYPAELNLGGDLKNYSTDPHFDTNILEIMKLQIQSIKQAGGCPILVLIPLAIKSEDRISYELETKKLFLQINSMGISNHVLNLMALETDPTLFTDQFHLSFQGREKWSKEIVNKILQSNICNLGGIK